MESSPNRSWSESFAGGSPQAEERMVRQFADQVNQIQRRNRRIASDPIRRAFHAKLLVAVANARLEISTDLRPEMAGGMFASGATYPAIVRLSSASGLVQGDDEADLRGIAVRIQLADGVVQDLLMTNAPASHARDARQFMVAGLAMAGGRRLGALVPMVWHLGPREAFRILGALRRAASRPVQSLATENFWSRGPFALEERAMKLILRPERPADSRTDDRRGGDFLRTELVERLRRGDVRWLLQVQHFVDERRTPIEDGTVEWTEASAPPESVAILTLPRQELAGSEGVRAERDIDALAFSPWNDGGGLRPIGGLNRARRLVYPASAVLRSDRSP